MKKLIVLGSTGSIGKSTLQVAKHLHQEIEIVGLAAKSNIDLLEQQAIEHRPKILAVFDKNKALELQRRLPHIPVLGGIEGLEAVASFHEANFVLSAITGTLGLIPTISAINALKNIGLANKEALVSGGSLVTALAKKKGVSIIPVDSEHSAIFQCLQGQDLSALKKIILTASGGPFRAHTTEQLNQITVDQALKHPTWQMGPKVTIDSSTLMNKGLEVIEAYWLFDVPIEKIEVIIHPQSIIHSMVEFSDGSLLAHMGEPMMVIPIQYALTFPKRMPGLLGAFDFRKHSLLEFKAPDFEKFICLKLAFHAVRERGSCACYMNAANEILVERFLKKEINWVDIGRKLEKLVYAHKTQNIENIDHILSIDMEARKNAMVI